MTIDNSKHLLATPQLIDALERGSVAKLLKAIQAGQDLQPVLPRNVSMRGEILSPLTYAYKWPWERRPDQCLELLNTLLKTGADPNLHDPQGRRPLHLLLWLARDAPKAAIQALVLAGADPCLISATAPSRAETHAFSLCVLENRFDAIDWIAEVVPGAAGSAMPPPLLTLAWNNSTLEQRQCDQMIISLLEAGADPDAVDDFKRSGRNQSERVASTIAQWEQAKAAEALRQALDGSTAQVGSASRTGPRL